MGPNMQTAIDHGIDLIALQQEVDQMVIIKPPVTTCSSHPVPAKGSGPGVYVGPSVHPAGTQGDDAVLAQNNDPWCAGPDQQSAGTGNAKPSKVPIKALPIKAPPMGFNAGPVMVPRQKGAGGQGSPQPGPALGDTFKGC